MSLLFVPGHVRSSVPPVAFLCSSYQLGTWYVQYMVAPTISQSIANHIGSFFGCLAQKKVIPHSSNPTKQLLVTSQTAFFVSCQNGIYYMHTKSYAFLDYKQSMHSMHAAERMFFLGGAACTMHKRGNGYGCWCCTIHQKHFLANGEITHHASELYVIAMLINLIRMWIARIYGAVWQCWPKGAHITLTLTQI